METDIQKTAAPAVKPDSERIIAIVAQLKESVKSAVIELIMAGAPPSAWGQMSEVCNILDRCWYQGNELHPRVEGRLMHAEMCAQPGMSFNEMGPWDQIQCLRAEIGNLNIKLEELKNPPQVEASDGAKE